MEWKDKLKCKITDLSESKVSVEITLFNEVSLGILYYENPKQGWSNKPIMPSRWRCVDAKVEGLYVYGGESLTPRDLMEWAQERVLEHRSKKSDKVEDKAPRQIEDDGSDEEPEDELPNLSDNFKDNIQSGEDQDDSNEDTE